MCSILGFCSADGDYTDIQKALRRTASRGPDDSRTVNTGNGWLGFNRLSIMGISVNGMQPFVYGKRITFAADSLAETDEGYALPEESELVLVCNEEIYGFRELKEDLIRKGYTFISGSDCEILPALYREYGTEKENTCCGMPLRRTPSYPKASCGGKKRHFPMRWAIH